MNAHRLSYGNLANHVIFSSYLNRTEVKLLSQFFFCYSQHSKLEQTELT